MADVEIKYGNTIIPLDISGSSEVLETNGATMEDDVTVTYSKQMTRVTSSELKGSWYYVDQFGILHSYNATNVGQAFDAYVPKHSLIAVRYNSTSETIATPTGCTLVSSYSIPRLHSEQFFVFQAD